MTAAGRGASGVLDRVEAARRRRPKLRDTHITSAHGAGGKATATLVDAVFLEALRNPLLEPLEDAAVFDAGTERLALTTDSFVVTPLFFPGGNIGDLAVNGTVNDLAVAGARPLHLASAVILEEGMDIADLRRIVASMAEAATRAGVSIVTGDTKVVQRGRADGCYITTTGVGLVDPGLRLGASLARPGDVVVVTGPIGDHGITVLLARGELDLSADLRSDTAPLSALTARLLAAVNTPGGDGTRDGGGAPGSGGAPGGGGVRAMRDATRGGVATILNEVAKASGVGVVVDEAAVPVRTEVRGACELLGLDPLYVACEGRMVVIVAPEAVDTALAALRADPLGAQSTVIGRIVDDPPGTVLLNTAFGGTRIVDLLVGDPLPRIC
ncbi:hydrogenase expression/formation protein HypE [Parafrankia sp. EUN1f]|uniref:hydrogenase expression/formation protein HypE n=1 Tax=Parafrankia sp. EUN1f TaxID=102897 RepID=UPI0001C450E2|nr:hydrogenase expression/formation protein HypE [Parafrankia sp. EUN1f]EFC86635.1 hydrogenase expression/formation protein HypE [Parafrankia sp. EUN1f]